MAEFNIKSRKTRLMLWILIVIIGPIVCHQVIAHKDAAEQRRAMSAPVMVQTIKPVIKEIYSKGESTGRLEAKYTVDIVARINGWLQKRFFEEGAEVKKGQTLFLIEPDEYEAAYNNAAANARRAEAALVNAEQELKRAGELVKKDYVSRSYYDEAVSVRNQNKAALDAAKAQLETAKLNLGYTKIVSPIDGKIGKIFITEGNLVNAQTGALARIVSIKPIYAYFTLNSSDYLRFKKLENAPDLSGMEVKLKLSDGSIYSEKGRIEFVDNTVNQTTGTIALRAVFDNEDELLVPGDFVNVMIKADKPQKVLLIPQSAALDDAQGYYVWAVTPDNKAVRRDIKVSDEIDKNWIVLEGLTEQDKIIGKGLQSIRRPGQAVKPAPLETEQKK